MHRTFTLDPTSQGRLKRLENAWLGHHFESSTGLTSEFSLFRKQIKRFIKNALPPYLELIMPFGSLHFSFSGFIKNLETGKYVYFSCSDVRSFPDDWYYNLLIRTAKDERDFTGGMNRFIKLPSLISQAIALTSL